MVLALPALAPAPSYASLSVAGPCAHDHTSQGALLPIRRRDIVLFGMLVNRNRFRRYQHGQILFGLRLDLVHCKASNGFRMYGITA